MTLMYQKNLFNVSEHYNYLAVFLDKHLFLCNLASPHTKSLKTDLYNILNHLFRIDEWLDGGTGRCTLLIPKGRFGDKMRL